MIQAPLKPGDVVQLTEKVKQEVFYQCLMYVTEIKPWGVVGAIVLPESRAAYYRAEWTEFELVGHAPLKLDL